MKHFQPRISAVLVAAVVIIVVLASNVTTSTAHPTRPVPPTKQIDLAICLDTSGSMSGLIESAKQKLWAIVNDFALVEPAPELRVALLTYGNDGHNPETGWVAMETPFTHDLDVVSQCLFALTTNGGTEYVGRVLQKTMQLNWTRNPGALRLVVVAGNESANQDPMASFRAMCSDLVARDTVVNAIYCGSAEDNIAPGWREVARLGQGQFASIDHNRGTVVIKSPFDGRLGELSSALNSTYVPFGREGKKGHLNQMEQDANASFLNSSAQAARARTKASPNYRNSWDLVDAINRDQLELSEVGIEDLPAEMKEMTDEDRETYLTEKEAERLDLQKQIAVLSEKRDAFLEEEMKRQSIDETDSFDFAIRQAIRQQAEAKGFVFKKRDPGKSAARDTEGSQE